MRVPDWIEGLEPVLRADIGRAMLRGNVSLSLKVGRDQGEAGEVLRVNPLALQAVLRALSEVEAAAMSTGVTLAQATAADVLVMRGVLDAATIEADTSALRAALMEDFPKLISDFNAMRAAEGAALNRVIAGQLGTIAALTADAATEALARRDSSAVTLRDALARVLANAEGVDATRLAQELAMLAVKTDVTEELDRLAAHIGAARSLLDEAGQVGRKFDFLMQEFMREANTLCSKAASLALTRIGLDLKTVIDQLREQVQNVE